MTVQAPAANATDAAALLKQSANDGSLAQSLANAGRLSAALRTALERAVSDSDLMEPVAAKYCSGYFMKESSLQRLTKKDCRKPGHMRWRVQLSDASVCLMMSITLHTTSPAHAD